MNLLIVDDEIVTTQVLEEQLDRALLSIDQIYVAYNTSMARDILQKNKVELILCDIEMPKENGIHFLEWVREQKIQTEVIFLTSHEKFEYAYGAVQNGAANYLLKPIEAARLEKTLARASKASGDSAGATQYDALANARQQAIEKYLWNDKEGWYADYDLKSKKVRNQLTAAALFPLYVKAAAQDRADKVAAATSSRLLKPGGIATTTVNSGQQWDAPNGWAPLQWVATEGLQNYGQKEVAMDISWHFLTNVQHTYDREKKLVEKYDVSTTGTGGGGGEYPLQDGFGWTNGVTLKMLDLICPKEQPCDNVPATRPTVKSATTQPSTKEAQPTP